MKVVVTGGAGYIGTELVYRLSGNPGISEIIVYDNLCKNNFNLFTGLRKLPCANVRFVEGDILDSRKLANILQDVDVVYHLAAKVTNLLDDQNPHQFEQINHWGSAELVYALEEVGSATLVFLSTKEVYGEGEVLSTETPLNPKSFYGMSKARAEQQVQRLASKMPVYVFRLGQVFGYSKNLRFETQLNRLVFDAHFHDLVTIHGPVDYQMNYIAIERVIDTLEHVASGSLGPGTYNLGQWNLNLAGIVDALQETYPKLEVIYTDQHLRFPSLVLHPDERVHTVVDMQATLADEIERFAEMFTF